MSDVRALQPGSLAGWDPESSARFCSLAVISGRLRLRYAEYIERVPVLIPFCYCWTGWVGKKVGSEQQR